MRCVYARLVVKTSERSMKKGRRETVISRLIADTSVRHRSPKIRALHSRRLRAFTGIKQQVTQFSQGTIAHVDQSEMEDWPLARGSQGTKLFSD